jgi:excisionase family DNA binding protein
MHTLPQIVDVLNEQTLTLGEAAKRLHVAFTTVYRWALRGIPGPDGRRVRLRAARVGASWRTSEEAIGEFVEATTPHFDADTAPSPRTEKARRRASEAAAKRLAEAGI